MRLSHGGKTPTNSKYLLHANATPQPAKPFEGKNPIKQKGTQLPTPVCTKAAEKACFREFYKKYLNLFVF